VDGFVIEAHQLLGLESNHCVRPTVVIAELNLIDFRIPVLNYGADLASEQTFRWEVFEQCDYRKGFNVRHNLAAFFFILQKNLSTSESLLRISLSKCYEF
jgi:hypothetical protein